MLHLIFPSVQYWSNLTLEALSKIVADSILQQVLSEDNAACQKGLIG